MSNLQLTLTLKAPTLINPMPRCPPPRRILSFRCSAAARRSYSVTLLPCDGIGPEVISVAKDALSLAASSEGIEIKFKEMLVGGAALDATGVPLPAETLAAAKNLDAVLLGAIGGYKWDANEKSLKPETGLLQLRAGLEAFANLRPAALFPQVLSCGRIHSKERNCRRSWTSWLSESSLEESISENLGVLELMTRVTILVSILKCILLLRLTELHVLHLRLLASDMVNYSLLTRLMFWRPLCCGGKD